MYRQCTMCCIDSRNTFSLNDDSQCSEGRTGLLCSSCVGWSIKLGGQAVVSVVTAHSICLQFVFPFYIWLILLFVILVSRRSTILPRMIGTNAVPVLATVLLLSYTKLFQTVLSALRYLKLVLYFGKNYIHMV